MIRQELTFDHELWYHGLLTRLIAEEKLEARGQATPGSAFLYRMNMHLVHVFIYGSYIFILGAYLFTRTPVNKYPIFFQAIG